MFDEGSSNVYFTKQKQAIELQSLADNVQSRDEFGKYTARNEAINCTVQTAKVQWASSDRD